MPITMEQKTATKENKVNTESLKVSIEKKSKAIAENQIINKDVKATGTKKP